MKIVVRFLCGAFAVGSMAVAVTVPSAPAFADGTTCKQRCDEKYNACFHRCGSTKAGSDYTSCVGDCDRAQTDCQKDCDAK